MSQINKNNLFFNYNKKTKKFTKNQNHFNFYTENYIFLRKKQTRLWMSNGRPLTVFFMLTLSREIFALFKICKWNRAPNKVHN